MGLEMWTPVNFLPKQVDGNAPGSVLAAIEPERRCSRPCLTIAYLVGIAFRAHTWPAEE
jgi:hypothetical protein